MISRNQFWTQI